MMKNTWRGIMHNTWRISRKLPRNMADDDADHFYDAEGEPSANNNANNLSDNTDRPPPIPPSDTDSTVEDGSQWDNSYAPAPFYRLTSSAQTSPLSKSPWSLYTEQPEAADSKDNSGEYVGLMTSLVREEGHIYSLAASGDLLYTGSSSRNIRVWKSQKEYTGFKCHSGLVKSIVISGEKVFTGHQDGKIRVWKTSRRDPKVHKKIGTLPSFTSVVKNMMIPKSYTEMAGNHSGIWIKHLDAISSLSLNEDQTLLYSGSWDKTLKVWRVSDFECLESICAHEDVINVVVAGFDGFVFSGAADGTLKVWRKEYSQGKRPKHYFSHTLLKQEFAVTSLAVNPTGMVVYAGCSDGVVQFWEKEKLTHGGALRGHKLAVLCLAATGNMVFSGSADKHICVWQRDEGGAHKCLYVLNGHTGPVKCLAVEEDGGNGRCILYSGSLDKSVKIWRMGRQVSLKCNQQLPPPSPQRIDGLRRSRK